MGIHMQKTKMKLDLYLISYMKINTKYIIDLNVKLLKESRE